MSDTNPYTPPSANIQPPQSADGSLPLATPWIRLAAQIIDGLILFPVNYLLQKLFFKVPDQEELTRIATETMKNGGDAMTAGIEAAKAAMPSPFLMILVQLLAIAAFLAINFTFLKNGQSIGKKVLKLQIQSRDGEILPIKELLLKRLLPVYVAAVIPIVGAIAVLIDALCIFRKDRNTLHDDLALTKVVVLPA